MKHGEVPEFPPEMVIKLEDIIKEAGDLGKMFNAVVREYKELRELYKQSLYNSDGTYNILGWLS